MRESSHACSAMIAGDDYFSALLYTVSFPYSVSRKMSVYRFLFILSALCLSPSVTAANLFSFPANDEDVIWRSGLNRYIKLVQQDSTRFGPNEHPVEIDAETLKYALSALEIPDDGFFADDDAKKKIFTIQQINRLGEELPRGLQKAAPTQDIIFVLEKNENKFLGMQEKRAVAGRVFYKDGRLNIIIGDYDFFRSKAFEAAYDPSGRAAVPYSFNFGKRARGSKAFANIPQSAPGVVNKLLDKLRHDWLVIDLERTADAYVAKSSEAEDSVSARQDETLQLEIAKLAKQRREMRLEMARLRKEMQEGNNGSAESVEKRLTMLKRLLKQKLITRAEYEAKREKILKEL